MISYEHPQIRAPVLLLKCWQAEGSKGARLLWGRILGLPCRPRWLKPWQAWGQSSGQISFLSVLKEGQISFLP